MKLGIIGYGAIAELVLTTLKNQSPHPLDGIVCLRRRKATADDRSDPIVALFGNRLTFVDNTEGLLAAEPDMVVEAASHDAVHDYGEAVLNRGVDLVLASVGALVDDALHARMRAAAINSGARLHLPCGAVGAIDMLAAARLSGLEDVQYISRKPPEAWRGTKAECVLALDQLCSAAVFYEGTARDAARDYPKNANVAAIIALAGAGFDRTRVRLIADPEVTDNIHEFSARADCADFSFRIAGRASSANPRTSMSTGYSIARAVLNQVSAEVI